MCGTGDRGAGDTPSTSTTTSSSSSSSSSSTTATSAITAMPASSSDDPVSSALHMSLLANKCSTLKCNSSSSLGSGDGDISSSSLDNKLVASTKRVLLAEIAFEKCNSYKATVLDSLKQRYIVVNTAANDGGCSSGGDVNKVGAKCGDETSSATKKTKVSSSGDDGGGGGQIGLPKPKLVLFPAESVQLGWPSNSVTPVGAGMINLRNTCYLNSALQALFHVPSFVNWLLNDKSHVSKCQLLNGLTHSECLICAMKTVLIAHRSTNNAIKPLQIYSKLKLICKHFVHGQQEDAHEFLRYLIESMERSYLNVVGGLKFDSYSKETTPLNQIFGGYLRTEVTCVVCGHVSTTFQHFEDLPLDIRQVSSVEAALDTYFSREQLGSGEEAAPYKCDKCHRRVNATKKFSLQRAPNVLCLQLKRFGITGGKMSKHISLQMSLDITRYMHASTRGVHGGGQGRYRYRLVSMISHIGPSSGCGHYTAMAAASSGHFYLFDDSLVRQMSVSNVLYNSNAYVIIYELEPSCSSSSSSSSNSSSTIHHQRSSFSNNCTTAPSPSSSNSSSSSASGKIVQNGGGEMATKQSSYFSASSSSSTTSSSSATFHSTTKAATSSSQSSVAVTPKHERASSSTTCLSSASSSSTSSSPCPPPLSSASVLQQQRHNSNLTKQQSATASKKLLSNGQPSPSKQRLVPYTTTTESDSSNSSSSSGGEDDDDDDNADDSDGSDRRVVTSSTAFPRPPPPTCSSSSSSADVCRKLEIDCQQAPPPPPTSSTITWHVTEVSSQHNQQQHSASSISSVSSTSSSTIGNWNVTESSSSGSVAKKTQQQLLPRSTTTTAASTTTTTAIDSNRGVPIGQLTEQQVLSGGSKWNSNSNGGGGAKMWDGSRGGDTSAVNGLLSMSHRGYGGNSNVSTWEGGRSELDQQLDKEKGKEEQRRLKRNYYNTSSSYDDEMDRGKVKKVKYNGGGNNSSSQRYNPFQEHQNRKNNNWYGNNKRPPFYHNNSLDNRYRNNSNSSNRNNSYHRNNGFNRWRH